MTELETAKLIGIAAPYYQSFKPTKDDMRVLVVAWHRQVGHLDYQVAEAAMLDVCSRSKFFPTPAEILESVARITEPEHLTALEAWALVQADVRRGVGYPYAGVCDDPIQTTITDSNILAAVRAVGGWGLLQRATTEQDISNRSQFIACYNQLVARTQSEARTLPAVLQARQLHQANRVRQLVGNVVKQLGSK